MCFGSFSPSMRIGAYGDVYLGRFIVSSAASERGGYTMVGMVQQKGGADSPATVAPECMIVLCWFCVPRWRVY